MDRSNTESVSSQSNQKNDKCVPNYVRNRQDYSNKLKFTLYAIRYGLTYLGISFLSHTSILYSTYYFWWNPVLCSWSTNNPVKSCTFCCYVRARHKQYEQEGCIGPKQAQLIIMNSQDFQTKILQSSMARIYRMGLYTSTKFGTLLWSGQLSSSCTVTSHRYMQIQHNTIYYHQSHF